MISARERRLSLRKVRSKSRLRAVVRQLDRDIAKTAEAAQRPPEPASGPSERQALKARLSPARRAAMEALATVKVSAPPYPKVEPVVEETPKPEPRPKPTDRRGEIAELFRLAFAHPFGGHGAPFGYEIEFLTQEFLNLPPVRHDEIERWSPDEIVALRMLAHRNVQLSKAVKALGRTEIDVLRRARTVAYLKMPQDWQMAYGASFDV